MGYRHSEQEWKGFLKWSKARGIKVSTDGLHDFRQSMKRLDVDHVERPVNGTVEKGFVYPDEPLTVFVSEDRNGPHWAYPRSEDMRGAGWVPIPRRAR